MKRAKRRKVGNLTGRQRRRLQRVLRAVARGYGPGNWAYTRYPHQIRDARRLSEAGMVVAVVSKYAFLGRSLYPFRELALFSTREGALARYPRHCLMPGKWKK